MSAQGFSLVELLVVVAVMGILGVVGLANFGDFGEGQKTKSAALDIQSLLRTAQTSAGSKTFCTSDGGGHSGTWWVEFTTDRKTVNLICDLDPATTATTQIVKTYTLSASLQIDSLDSGPTVCSENYPGTYVRVNFAPLYATISFTHPLVACAESNQFLNFTLKNTKTNETKVVKVDKGGSVDVL